MGPNGNNPSEKAGNLDCSFSSTTDLLCDPWTSLVLNIRDFTSILTIISLPQIRRSFHYPFLAIPDILVQPFILFSIKPLKGLKTISYHWMPIKRNIMNERWSSTAITAFHFIYLVLVITSLLKIFICWSAAFSHRPRKPIKLWL